MNMKSNAQAMIATLLAANAPAAAAYGSHWEAEFYEGAAAGRTTNAMWVFAQDGVHIFSPDGAELLVRHDEDTACHAVLDPWSPPGTVQDDCWAMDPVHDGENYVFVGNNNWVEDGFVDVYSMWTGTRIASVPVCTLPYHMEYAPGRRELWVSCWLRPQDENSSNETDRGTIEVIQTQALGAPPAQISTRGWDQHVHSDVVVDASIPNKAYELSMESDTIYEIDSGSKAVRDEVKVQKTVGTYEHAFSPKNKHIFLRTYVCCACGEFKDTREPCEDYMEESPVLVEYGPSAGNETQPGTCGKFCKGSLADVNGIWEFDTKTNTHVAQHFAAAGATGAKPFASPLGEYVLIGGGDGGDAVKVLRAGKNGEASAEVGIIELGFGADEGTHALSDISFIKGDSRNIAVFTSTLNNHIVIADLGGFDSATPDKPHKTSGVDLDLFDEPREDVSVKHDIRGISIRQVAWAAGTDYVWVSSPMTGQVHIIELGPGVEDARVVRTLDDIDMARHFLWVASFRENALESQAREVALAEKAREDALEASLANLARENALTTQQVDDGQEQFAASSRAELAGVVDNMEGDTTTAKNLGITGVVLGAVAILVSVINLIKKGDVTPKPSQPATYRDEQPSVTTDDGKHPAEDVPSDMPSDAPSDGGFNA
mmetsp:Transcript_19021/g.45658  ORF Transcript_19021/g.45658 Transcript_19021/m.45658 type:complete len:657 (+) Transcript_19021:460-2430(+)|eukprot:CAMPEP_0181095782 /NCGR_PEP_ID=MMETSP1071-20121207/10693_1 /TAXON_ID=35127 /ORGANISM="Thalassiosira sp., Strain NH16" /LENGTH=656 /DNA_ID=CAMNT_0023178167 /DNA_START=781 /DNA_END=2751 /DNA_ORIENTATION=-